MDTKELLEISNKLSNEDFVELININSKRFFAWNPHDKTCYDLDNDVPACLNGGSIQINIDPDDFKFKPIVDETI